MTGTSGSALEALGQVSRALTQLQRIDPATAAWRELLDAASANLGELARTAREYGAALEFLNSDLLLRWVEKELGL